DLGERDLFVFRRRDGFGRRKRSGGLLQQGFATGFYRAQEGIFSWMRLREGLAENSGYHKQEEDRNQQTGFHRWYGLGIADMRTGPLLYSEPLSSIVPRRKRAFRRAFRGSFA